MIPGLRSHKVEVGSKGGNLGLKKSLSPQSTAGVDAKVQLSAQLLGLPTK